MRRSLLVTLPVFLVFWSFAARGDDGVDQIAGAWQQIESNAGTCPHCRVSIDQHDSSVTVTANNGWSADLVVGKKDGSVKAIGKGRWRSSLTGAIAGKQFNVDFVLKDKRLYMSMLVDMGNGSRRTIRVVFGRLWSGV